MKQQLESFGLKELGPWREKIDKAFSEIDDVEGIVDFVKKNPGTVQANIGKELGVQPELVRWYLYEAEKEGAVKREKHGRSYKVYWID